MRKQPSSKVQSANSLCRALDHDWMHTLNTTYRVCKREQCRASQRLLKGQWVSNAAALCRHVPAVATGTRQSVLWDTGTPIHSISNPSTRKEP